MAHQTDTRKPLHLKTLTNGVFKMYFSQKCVGRGYYLVEDTYYLLATPLKYDKKYKVSC